MFRPFPNWPSSGWNTISEELYTYYNTIISVSEYKKGGRDLVYNKQGMHADCGKN